MKILAIDPGEKFFGLAIADLRIKIAMPYGVLESKNRKEIIKQLKGIIEKEKIQKVIIGLPLSFSGRTTEQTEKTNQFIENFKREIPLPVVIVDERLTSKTAKKMSFKNENGHAVAANIILQDYLVRH